MGDVGFDVMNVDVAIANDPKFRRIARDLGRPEHVAPAIAAYVALLGESWKAAERARIQDAWPPLLVFDPAVVESMTTVKLIDKTGKIPSHAWQRRFTEANRRRQLALARYRRYNEKRGQTVDPRTNDDDATTLLPRGSHGVTTRPTDRPTDLPSDRPGGRAPAHAHEDEEFPALAYLASVGATVQPTGNGYHRELVTLVARQGSDRVIEAMRARHATGDKSARQLIYGAANDLEPIGGRNGTTAKGHTRTAQEAIDAFDR